MAGARIGEAPAELRDLDVPGAVDDGAPAGPGAAAPSNVVILPPEHFIALAGSVVRTSTNVVCDKVRVTRLDDSEVRDVAVALAQLAQAYNLLGQLDPRTAALLSFAVVVAGVVTKREKLPPIEAVPEQQAA